jgi:hypothetical protein
MKLRLRLRTPSPVPGGRDASATAAVEHDASRCTGANRYGTQCRLDAAPGTDRCTFHPYRKEQAR